MTDETDSETEFDPEEDIVEYDDLTADDLYEVIEEARLLDLPAMEARIEIERRHVLEYEGYAPTFSTEELFQIGMALMDAKEKRWQRDEDHRVDVIDDLADTFLEGIASDDGMEIEVEEREEFPEMERLDDEIEIVSPDDEE